MAEVISYKNKILPQVGVIEDKVDRGANWKIAPEKLEILDHKWIIWHCKFLLKSNLNPGYDHNWGTGPGEEKKHHQYSNWAHEENWSINFFNEGLNKSWKTLEN